MLDAKGQKAGLAVEGAVFVGLKRRRRMTDAALLLLSFVRRPATGRVG